MNLPTTQYFPASSYMVRTSSLRSTSQPPVTMHEPPHYAVTSQPPVTMYEPPHYAVLPSLLLQCTNFLASQ